MWPCLLLLLFVFVHGRYSCSFLIRFLFSSAYRWYVPVVPLRQVCFWRYFSPICFEELFIVRYRYKPVENASLLISHSLHLSRIYRERKSVQKNQSETFFGISTQTRKYWPTQCLCWQLIDCLAKNCKIRVCSINQSIVCFAVDICIVRWKIQPFLFN